MKLRISLTIAALLLTSVELTADGSQKHKPKHENGGSTVVVRDADRPAASVHIVFSSHDARVIREYYAPRYQNLPPGLQKKMARGGSLPPGWQKKIRPLPVVVERELVVLPTGYRRGVIDGHAVIYKSGSPTIIDVAVLF
jgi:hypothetical protein